MKHRGTLGTILLFLLLAAGLSLLLYPTVSNAWNARRQTRAIADYAGQVAALDADEAARMREEAETYNRSLLARETGFALSEERQADYDALLNVSGTGVMGYLEIPEIGVSLPVYHGTDDGVLQTAVGHLEWSSLPVGGKGTHCVLSGHRGLPSAKLFTNLDQLSEGDRFYLRVLGEVLTYEVDSIRIVLPQETELLAIDPEEDYCTLVTCTPYGVNTHRLLVRGRRTENPAEARTVRVTADALRVDPFAAAAVAFPLLLLPMLAVLLLPRRRTTFRGRMDR